MLAMRFIRQHFTNGGDNVSALFVNVYCYTLAILLILDLTDDADMMRQTRTLYAVFMPSKTKSQIFVCFTEY